MILYELGSHKILRRVWVDWGDQKGYDLAKVGMHGEGIHGGGIDGVISGWRLILGMKGGDQRPPRRRNRAVLDSLSKLSFFQAFITYLIVE